MAAVAHQYGQMYYKSHSKLPFVALFWVILWWYSLCGLHRVPFVWCGALLVALILVLFLLSLYNTNLRHSKSFVLARTVLALRAYL